MKDIVRAHFPELDHKVLEGCVQAFYRLRSAPGVEKKPATRELVNWVRALTLEPDFSPKALERGKSMPFLGILFKKSTDLELARRFTEAGRT